MGLFNIINIFYVKVCEVQSFSCINIVIYFKADSFGRTVQAFKGTELILKDIVRK